MYNNYSATLEYFIGLTVHPLHAELLLQVKYTMSQPSHTASACWQPRLWPVCVSRCRRRPCGCWLRWSRSHCWTWSSWTLSWWSIPTPWLRPTACGRGFVCWATTCSPAAAEPARNSKPGVCLHVCFTYYIILLRHFIIHVFAIFSARMEQRTYLLESSHLYSVIDLRQVSCCVDYVIAPVICHLETSQYVCVCFFCRWQRANTQCTWWHCCSTPPTTCSTATCALSAASFVRYATLMTSSSPSSLTAPPGMLSCYPLHLFLTSVIHPHHYFLVFVSSQDWPENFFIMLFSIFTSILNWNQAIVWPHSHARYLKKKKKRI